MNNFIHTFLRKSFSRPLAFFGTFFIIFTSSYTLLTLTDFIPESTFFNLEGGHINSIIALGVLSGILQLIGYIVYIKNEDIDPNPVTWFMFAYGTLVLAVLEWDSNATFSELILPTVCGIMAIVVSIRCWRHARIIDPTKWWPEDWWPEDRWDKLSLLSDIAITIAYIAAWCLATFAIVSTSEKEVAVLIFLFLSNLSTFPAFYPIIHTTITNPEREHWLPWIIWAAAYVVLGLVTYFIQGGFWHALMFYPASNAVLHAIVGFLALRK